MEFKKIQTIAFFALLIGVGMVFIWMIHPYLFPIFWAAVIAAIFHPVYRWLNKLTKQPGLSASITVVFILLVVLLPLAGILGIVIKQGVSTYEFLSEPSTLNKMEDVALQALHHPLVEKYAGNIDVTDKIKEASSTITSVGISLLTKGSQGTLTALVQVLVMLYTLYYFLKDGNQWLKRLMLLLPFGDKNEELLYEKFVSTGKATLKGTLLIGIVQGAMGGIAFAVVGLPSAAFWGLIMTVFSVIPAVGPGLVLAPAAIYLALTGQIWQAVTLVVVTVLIGFIDNILRPPLVGKDIQMHPLLILFSTIGGIGLFGISGVVVGPMIATFFFAVIQMYEKKYEKELHSSST